MSLALTKKRAPRVHEKTLLNQRMRFNQGYHDAYDARSEVKILLSEYGYHYTAGWKLGREDATAGRPHGSTGAAWQRFVTKHEGF